MKRFKILAIAAIGIALFSAFKIEAKKSSRFFGQGQGYAILEGSDCIPVTVDNAPQGGCSTAYTGAVCTSYGHPVYAALAYCMTSYPSGLLKRP